MVYSVSYVFSVFSMLSVLSVISINSHRALKQGVVPD